MRLTPASRRAKALTTKRRPSPRALATSRFLLLLTGLLPLACILGLAMGAVPIAPAEILSAVLGDGNSQASTIVLDIRLPRVLLAAITGASLALCGAAMQGLFRNPLADPSLIGVTAGASLGAAVAIVAGAHHLQGLGALSLVSIGAFAGGVISVLFVYRLATHSSGTSVATMLLAGIAITALAGAFSSLLEFFADNALLRRISLWKMGGLDGAGTVELWLGSAVTVLLCVTLPRYASALDAMLLGESEARHLGIDVARTKLILIILVAVGVGISVALVGTIAFVGLVVPHIVRLVIGPSHAGLLPASALAGALLLVVADLLSRTALAPTEIPVGIVTAILGVPFFISLLLQRHHYGMQS